MVGVYVGFRMMLADERTPAQYLQELQTGGRDRRWPAAFELSRLMADPRVEARHPELGPALVRAFEQSKGDDPRLRRYLALAIGRLSSPPREARDALLDATNEAEADSETVISAIWALAAIRDAGSAPRLQALYGSQDPGIRKVVVYALGALPGDGHEVTLRAALNDSAPDVQWNAAIALARRGDGDGVVVLSRMLDREYVSRVVTRTANPQSDSDPVSDVMVAGLQAIAALSRVNGGNGATAGVDAALRERVAALSRDDRSMRVRQAALDALNGKAPTTAGTHPSL